MADRPAKKPKEKSIWLKLRDMMKSKPFMKTGPKGAQAPTPKDFREGTQEALPGDRDKK